MAKFKSRYQLDPEFRKIQIQRSIDSRNKRREREKANKSAEALDKKVWRLLTVKGKSVRCCKVFHLAKAIERTPRTIQRWFDDAVLPETIRYNRRRYFTEKHYHFIIRVFKKHENDMKKFSKVIYEKWDTLY